MHAGLLDYFGSRYKLGGADLGCVGLNKPDHPGKGALPGIS